MIPADCVVDAAERFLWHKESASQCMWCCHDSLTGIARCDGADKKHVVLAVQQHLIVMDY